VIGSLPLSGAARLVHPAIMRHLFALLGAALLVARLVVACAPPSPPPLDPTHARASVVEMAFAVHAAAERCSSNARHLARFDDARSLALVDACTRHLVPARDAVAFVVVDVDPWKEPASSPAVGCAGKAVRVGLESVLDDFAAAGYSGSAPAVMLDGIKLGAALEPYAPAWCDPLRPTSRVSVFVDPRIAPCPAGACGEYR
jgi:hypothetical protein